MNVRIRRESNGQVLVEMGTLRLRFVTGHEAAMTGARILDLLEQRKAARGRRITLNAAGIRVEFADNDEAAAFARALIAFGE